MFVGRVTSRQGHADVRARTRLWRRIDVVVDADADVLFDPRRRVIAERRLRNQ